MKQFASLGGLLVLFTLTCGFQMKAPPAFRGAGTVTLNTNKDVRATFEEVAKAAGLSVVFGRNFSLEPTAVSFRAENLNITDALDRLSTQTSSFWTVWDDHTILVAEDNERNRRTYDRLFVAVIELPVRQDSKPVLDRLPGAVAVGNKIVIKGTTSIIEGARQTIAELVADSRIEATFLDATSEVFLTDGGSGLRSSAWKRAQFRVPPSAISLNESGLLREIYVKLAATGGLNIVFGRSFPNRNASFHSENMESLDALDLLSAQTGTVWQPINETTIQVFDDTPQNHRDLELRHLETIYLSGGTTAERMAAIVTAVRTVLGLRRFYIYEPRSAIVLHDTPENLLVAEGLISALEGTQTLSKAVITDLTNEFPDTGNGFHSAATSRASLDLRIAGTLPFNQSADSRMAYESLAQVAGLAVVFGGKFTSRTVNLAFKNIDAVEALDLLAQQSGTFWQPLDEHTILVLDDNQQNRRNYEVHLIKTILLPTRTTAEELNSLVNILRTAFSLRTMYPSMIAKAIVLHDTPGRVDLVEKLIRQLTPNPNAVVSLTVPSPGFTETSSFSNAEFARTKLDFQQTGPISSVLNQDARVAYQSLAQMGGIKINFDPQFDAGTPAPLRLAGKDIPDALDHLSLQTGSYWTVLDSKTILVATDTPQVRQQLDPQVSRTIGVKTLTPGFAAEVVNILRTVLSMRSVTADGAYSVTVIDTPQRVVIAEQIVANLDRP